MIADESNEDYGNEFACMKATIIHLKSKYNFQFEKLADEENYLLLIDDKSLAYKQLLIKQALINFKIFMRKFNLFSDEVNIFKIISTKQLVYILRHLDVDIQVKRHLLQVLVDYFSKCTQQRHLMQLLDDIVSLLALKLNESFDEHLFKLVTLGLTHTNERGSTQMRLGELISSHLRSCFLASSIQTIQNQASEDIFLEQFRLVINFLQSALLATDSRRVASQTWVMHKSNSNSFAFALAMIIQFITFHKMCLINANVNLNSVNNNLNKKVFCFEIITRYLKLFPDYFF